jgi:hypothetical protein
VHSRMLQYRGCGFWLVFLGLFVWRNCCGWWSQWFTLNVCVRVRVCALVCVCVCVCVCCVLHVRLCIVCVSLCIVFSCVFARACTFIRTNVTRRADGNATRCIPLHDRRRLSQSGPRHLGCDLFLLTL